MFGLQNNNDMTQTKKSSKSQTPANEQFNKLLQKDYQRRITEKKELLKEWRKAGEHGLIQDEANPAYLFNTTWTELLVKIASGQVDATFLAKMELVNRGLDASGKWVGFKEAEKLHFS